MRYALVVLLFWCLPAVAQVKGPAEVSVSVGRLASVPLTVDGEEIQYAVLGGEVFGGFREFSDPKEFRFQVLGYQAGVGYIVVGTTKGGKLQPLFTVKVTVTGVAPPPPGPDPPPPGPIDPAAVKIKAAFQATGFTRAAALAGGYDRCAALTAKTAPTGADLHAQCKAALKDAMGGERIPEAVITAVAAELGDMPAATTAALTVSEWIVAHAVLTRVAKLIRQAGGVQ